MSVQKRVRSGKTRWVGRYRDPGGKEHSKTFDTRREATAWVAERQRDVRRGQWVDPAHDDMTVHELVQAWIGASVLRPSTVTKYKSTLANLEPMQHLPASAVTTGAVNAWFSQLVGGRPWAGNKPLSESTARSMVRNLSTAYEWGITQGLVARNPVVVPKRSRTDAVMPEDIPTVAEIQAVVDCVRDGGAVYRHKKQANRPVETFTQGPYPTVAMMLEVAAATGLRVSELCGLTVGDVDLVNGVLKVRYQLGPRGVRVPLKTTRSRRDVPIAASISPMLQVLTVGLDASEFLFRQGNGSPWPVSRLSVIVKRAREHVGAPSVHFHALRHFFASGLLSAGVPVHEVAAVLGHSSQVLLSTYAHVLPGAGERARRVVDSLWCGTSAGREPAEGKEKPHLRW